MGPERLLQELADVAEAVGVTVRREPFGKGLVERAGARCRVNGRTVVLLNCVAPLPEQIRALAEALAPLETTSVSMSRSTRQEIAEAVRRLRWRNAVAADAVPLPLGPKPGLRSTRPR